MAFGLKYSAYKNNQRDALYISQKHALSEDS